MFCEPSHTRAARNSQTYIRNDPRDDINDSNDATDPVDDDSVTNYTRCYAGLLSVAIKNWKTTGRLEWIPPVYQEIYVCVCVCCLPDSVLRCQIIYYSRVSTNISPVCRLCLHSALDIILCSGKFHRVFTNLKYPDKSRMSLADCGPVCLCCDARSQPHNSVSLTDNLF